MSLELVIRTHDTDISEAERAKMELDLRTLRKVTDSFPEAQLHLDVRKHHRADDLHVKAMLRLGKHAMFTGERDILLHPAWERCLHKLVHKVRAYKDTRRETPERRKTAAGTFHDVRPHEEPDLAALSRAAAAGDYPAFRTAAAPYEGPLAERAGRMVGKIPAAEAALGRDFVIAEIVEETLLGAFDRFAKRPNGRLGQWLEDLIEPSIRVLLDDPSGERERLHILEELR